MENEQAPILIFGTGAMASLFAAHLFLAGVNVAMVGNWEEGVASIKVNGLRVDKQDSAAISFPIDIFHGSGPLPKIQLALICVKSWQTRRTSHQVKSCLDENGVALTLQNGLGNLEVLQEILGLERVLPGVTTLGATLVAPGTVKPGGDGKIVLANRDHSDIFKSIFEKSGFFVELANDFDAVVWGKLIVNAAINPLSAILRVPNGELLKIKFSRELMVSAACEAYQVALAQGVNLLFADPVPVVEEVAGKTSQNRSSMFQDILRGAPTEIDAINGAIVACGEKMVIPTPINKTLCQLVKSLAEIRSTRL